MAKMIELAKMLHRYRQGQIAAFVRSCRQTSDGLLLDDSALAGLTKAMAEVFDDMPMDNKATYYFQARYIMDELGLNEGSEEE